MDEPPPSKLKRDVTNGFDETMAMEPLDFEAFELLDTNHVGLETLPKLILQRLKEFNRYTMPGSHVLPLHHCCRSLDSQAFASHRAREISFVCLATDEVSSRTHLQTTSCDTCV